MSEPTSQAHHDRWKRALDICIAGAGLIVTAPVQLCVAVAIRSRLGSPVLFAQERPGRHGVPFVLVKFRTMHHSDPVRGLVSDAERLTPLGRWLRSTSLDELPTLWNVVRGDMSLVGPRPLLMAYLDRYTPSQARRHEVRPGITGLAQTAGRNALSWEQKFELDVRYVDARCPSLDARVLARTIGAVVGRTGISSEGNVTMPEFHPEPSQQSAGADA